MKYQELLKRLNERWKKTKPARGGVPDGLYTCKLVKTTVDHNLNKPAEKKRFYKVKNQFVVIEGKYKKRNIFINSNLLYTAEGDGPGGCEFFMADLEIMGIKLKNLDPKTVMSTMKAAYGRVVELSVKNNDEGFSNAYLRRLISKSQQEPPEEEETEDLEEPEEEEEEEELSLDDDLEDEEEEEDEEELSLDDTEFEDEPEEEEEDELELEPEPPKRKKKTSKKASKKAKTTRRKKETVPPDEAGSDDFQGPSQWDDEFGS